MVSDTCRYGQIGTATGQHSFAHEQARLVASQTPKFVLEEFYKITPR